MTIIVVAYDFTKFELFLLLILSLKCQHSGGAISVVEFGTTNDTLPFSKLTIEKLFKITVIVL